MMSSVESISYIGDDVFDETADDISLLNREWTLNMKKRVRVKRMVVLYLVYFTKMLSAACMLGCRSYSLFTLLVVCTSCKANFGC